MPRILVIDDDLDLLQMMRLMLQRGGHEVAVTADSADGIAKAKQLRPDMAIVDVMMPGMNGYQVVRRLREDPITADMAILILTARVQSIDRDAAMSAQADDYMAKPVAPTELLNKVSELLNRRSQPVMPSKLVVTVFSLRGGSGVTTVATNLGLAFQQIGRNTCLVDLSTRSGHVATQLRLQAKTSWMDLLPQMNTLSSDTVVKALLRHNTGVHVLASPFLPPVQPVESEALSKLIALLKVPFDVIVMDSSGALDVVAHAALSSSDDALILMTPEVASLQSTVALMRMFPFLNLRDEKVVLAVNQVTPRAGLSVAAIEKALNRQIKVTIPYDEAQAVALGQGTPLMQSNPEASLPAAVKQAIQVLAQLHA